MHIVNPRPPFSAVNSSSSINIANKPCELWATHERPPTVTCCPHLTGHPDTRIYPAVLFAFKYSNFTWRHWSLKTCFEHWHYKDIFYLFRFWKVQVVYVCWQNTKFRKTLCKFGLPRLQTQQWEAHFWAKQTIHLSVTYTKLVAGRAHGNLISWHGF